MGYNNNNAGIHYKNWNGVYGAFDDGRETDRIAMENRNFSHNKSKSTKENNNTSNNHVVTEPSNNSDNKYLIDIEHFINREIVPRNAYRIGFERNIDVTGLLYDLEYVIETDYRIQNEFRKKPKRHNGGFPKADEIFIFLSLLANNLHCSMQTLFIDDDLSNKNFAYTVIKKLSDFYWEDTELTQEEFDSGDYFEIHTTGIDLMELFNIKVNTSHETHEFFQLYDERNFFLEKDFTSDGNELYTLGYGSMLINSETKNHYIQHGCRIWSEAKGKLADYAKDLFEKKIVIYDENDDIY